MTFVVGVFGVIISMYGGGFATIPAYLADLFGTQYVGAIHGRLLTAWSTAGVVGPVLVNYLREFQLKRGVPNEAAYNETLYILSGLLFLGLICNLLVKPVAQKHFMTAEELAEDRRKAHVGSATTVEPEEFKSAKPSKGSWVEVGIGWALVSIPLAWGVMKTFEKSACFFK
mgnify:CR=1 FL=1